jgi:hypothetical protein
MVNRKLKMHYHMFRLFFRMVINLDFICFNISLVFIWTISTTVKFTSLFANKNISTLFVTFLKQLSQCKVRDRKVGFLNNRLFHACLWQSWPQSYKGFVFLLRLFYMITYYYLNLTRNCFWTPTTFLCRPMLFFCPTQIAHARENTVSCHFS